MEYAEKVKRLMGKIGQTYCLALPQGWSFFQVIAVENGTDGGIFLETYVSENEDIYKWLFDTDCVSLTAEQFQAITDGRNVIVELYEECVKQGSPWIKLIYTMDVAGHFHCDFKYPPDEG